MKPYCTQNSGNCLTCSLVNYNKDCQNNEIVDKLDNIRLRVTTDYKKKVEALAGAKGMNVSELIRYLIQKEFDK